MSPDPRTDGVPWRVYARDREEDQRDRDVARRELREDFDQLRAAIEAGTAETHRGIEQLHSRVSTKFGELKGEVDSVKKELADLRKVEQVRSGVVLSVKTIPVVLSAVAAVLAIVTVALSWSGNL